MFATEVILTLYITIIRYCSDFQDIFDVDYFMKSLRDEIRIVKELPPRLKKRFKRGMVPSMPPISWSNISYYREKVC